LSSDASEGLWLSQVRLESGRRYRFLVRAQPALVPLLHHQPFVMVYVYTAERQLGYRVLGGALLLLGLPIVSVLLLLTWLNRPDGSIDER
jgi:hypothetical protein